MDLPVQYLLDVFCDENGFFIGKKKPTGDVVRLSGVFYDRGTAEGALTVWRLAHEVRERTLKEVRK